MSVRTRIIDNRNNAGARVSDEGALVVTTVPASSALLAELGVIIDQSGNKRLQFLNGLMGSTGLDSGVTNMNVNGSVTPQTFTVIANPDYDIVITTIVLMVTAGAISLSKFGSLSALTNGVDLTLYESGNTTPIIKKAKTNGSLLTQTGMLHPFGNANDVNIIPSYIGIYDAVIVPVNFSDFIPDGLRITKGSSDHLDFVVNDNLTGLNSMDVRIMGHKVY